MNTEVVNLQDYLAAAGRPTLNAGEVYAGILLGKDGVPDQHIILLPGDAEELDWEAAKAWAAEVGGELPTRREQHLLIANLKEEFESNWYWSSEQHASHSDYAWYQRFSNGGQGYGHKDLELRARAVRRLVIE
jgi:hypothetical protein